MIVLHSLASMLYQRYPGVLRTFVYKHTVPCVSEVLKGYVMVEGEE